MPIVSNLGFARSDLRVAYRGGVLPQIVGIDVSLSGADPESIAPIVIEGLVDQINAGGAGGAEFPPELGEAQVLSGPMEIDEPEATGPDYHWDLQVRAVSPRFVRNIVESMTSASAVVKVQSMRVTGSLPLDEGPLSVRDAQVRAWLDDPTAYLGAWPELGFPVHHVASPRGVTLRVRLAGELTDEHYDSLTRLLDTWGSVVQFYANLGGTEMGAMQPDAHLGRTKREFRAGKLFFDHTYAPTRDVLVNLLSRFHRVEAPIEQVEIGMS
ncbi:hypothetical protein BE04_24725 [Sorangium cellulosum]|uniref:Uncharacterized protein n=1 Tax=Sorangium cellulosum TaxID=56 RepID=A0A150P2P9_SORCE|nr:hypothetical protein BE04_24725 [Sorangium cellulosum]